MLIVCVRQRHVSAKSELVGWVHTIVSYVLISLQRHTRGRLFTSVSGCENTYGGFHWTGNDVVSSRCVQSFQFLDAKIESTLQATETTCCSEKWCENNSVHLHLSAGIFPPPFSPLCPLLNLSVPRQAVQIKGICYHLVFFLNGYTCGTSGSRPDSLLTFLCSILCSHGNCCMFGRKLLKAVEKERAEGGSIKGEQAREGGRADELSVVGLHPV